MPDADPYPARPSDRDRFILDHRPPRSSHDPWAHQGVVVDDERMADGSIGRMATVFLTGRECPWRCLMCDLWRYTTVTATPAGAIAAQIATARATLGSQGTPVDGTKLYNAGSFFDPGAVPDDDYDDIASALAGLSRVVVESHPSLIGFRLDRWLASLHRCAGIDASSLEVAMGLETANPDALELLNKRMTVDTFRRAASSLAARGVGLRVFLLLSVPFVPASEQRAWLLRSLDTAFECGAAVVSLIPTRTGNGAIDRLSAVDFRPPALDGIEADFEAALAHASGRVFIDTWDLGRFGGAPCCRAARHERLHAMNLAQQVLPRATCATHAPAVSA